MLDRVFLQGRRMSQRSAAKRVKYDVDLSDEDAGRDDEDADEDEDSGGGFQKLKRQSRMPAAAKKASPLASQKISAPQQEAEPVDSAAGTATAKRRLSMTAAANGHLEPVAEEEQKETADEPEMTQKSTQQGSQKAQKREVHPHPCDLLASYAATPHCMPVCKCCCHKTHAGVRA